MPLPSSLRSQSWPSMPCMPAHLVPPPLQRPNPLLATPLPSLYCRSATRRAQRRRRSPHAPAPAAPCPSAAHLPKFLVPRPALPPLSLAAIKAKPSPCSCTQGVAAPPLPPLPEHHRGALLSALPRSQLNPGTSPPRRGEALWPDLALSPSPERHCRCPPPPPPLLHAGEPLPAAPSPNRAHLEVERGLLVLFPLSSLAAGRRTHREPVRRRLLCPQLRPGTPT